MAFEQGHEHSGGKKKGMSDYRASLTREAYENNPSQCLNTVINIINDAEKGDPVARKIFAQSYMTKAPAELHVTNTNINETPPSKEEYEFLKQQMASLYGEDKAISMLEGMMTISKLIKDYRSKNSSLPISND